MIDLRSDTVTTPTAKMRRAMVDAPVGDDLFREDPTVNLLQETAAAVFGQESALFVPSGTMGNQIAVRLHTQPGQEVIVESRSHMFDWEMGMMAAFSGCQARPVIAENGVLKWPQIESAISPSVYYRADTGLVALENTHNMAGGVVMSREETQFLVRKIHEQKLPVHMDAARIFNAAVALEESVENLTKGCDSVMICLSKGLCAPIGSILLGSRGFIEEAWSVRKMMGGGMRQVGVIAAAGLVAIEEMPKRLVEDHENAKLLAEALVELEHFSLDLPLVQTNIVVCDLHRVQSNVVIDSLAREGVLAVPLNPTRVRFVTHRNVSRQETKQAIEVLRSLDKDGF